jgi:hypothetical protein
MLQRENYDYVKHMMYRFQDAPYIRHQCEDVISYSNIFETPGTFLVHTTRPFTNPEAPLIIEAYLDILERLPVAEEIVSAQ